MKIKKGDTVMVIAGKDKGKTGTVTRVMPDTGKLIVEGLNMVKKAVKPNPMFGQRGGHVETEAPLHICKVMYYDLKTNKPTRLGITAIKGEKKSVKRVRVTKKSGEQLDN
ncbi:MAG: 50S ribosomal protein L24 [Candidatus Melainabacteria bacterium]